MTITISQMVPAIKRHLSIIGKRLYTKEGKNLFSDITTSTAEDPIHAGYVLAALQNVRAVLAPLTASFATDAAGVATITLAGQARKDGGFETTLADYIRTYATLYGVGEYLGMAHPELADKYRTDAASALTALQVYAFHKEPPTASASDYKDSVTGTIT